MNYTQELTLGLNALSVAQTYAEDGAPATAADRAETAAFQFRIAARIRAEALGQIETPPNLSKRAAKLLARLRGGAYYKHYAPDTPKAMHELVDAGLVTTCGRPVIIERCYVPASGYTPYKNERFEDDPFDTLTRQALDDLAEVRDAICDPSGVDEHSEFETHIIKKLKGAIKVLDGLR